VERQSTTLAFEPADVLGDAPAHGRQRGLDTVPLGDEHPEDLLGGGLPASLFR